MRATLHLELKTSSGETIETRHAHNAVMRAGARLVADLFAKGGRGITHMGVGTSDAPEDAFITDHLTNDPAAALQGDTEAAIPAEAFGAPQIDEARRVVRVRFRASLPASAAVGTVREAGLISRSDGVPPVLYNRVTFAPITKGDDHELTLFWEVAFPYGDLQWLM
jgi:hypothetical protein